ncbi:SRPBCC family protein [Streptomyces daliensis]
MNEDRNREQADRGGPASARTGRKKDELRTGGARPAIRLERRLAHPPEKVWRALTEPEQLVHWFPAAVEAEPFVGGGVAFAFPGEEPATGGEVTEFDPPRVFAFTWEGDHLRWEVAPDGTGGSEGEGGSVLTLVHSFDDRYGAASFATGWSACVAGLAALLSGEPVPEGDPDDMAATHERYVREFALSEGVSSVLPGGGWQVRFERQLVRPAEVAWERLDPEVDAELFPLGGETAADPPVLLEREWLAGGGPGGRVRWEFTEGTGHGARLVLTLTGPPGDDERQRGALAAGRARVERFAGLLLGA